MDTDNKMNEIINYENNVNSLTICFKVSESQISSISQDFLVADDDDLTVFDVTLDEDET